MIYRCYAKVNLTLEILRRRDDGFHEIASLVHTISLADDLRVEPADVLLTRVEGLEIDPEANLVARAAETLASATGVKGGAELSLVKNIPAAAGLGGGSSDAATTLVGLNTLWNSRLSLAQLQQLAAELGSDVPFFIRGGAAVMRGRGEEVHVLPPVTGQWLVLVVPRHDVTDKTRRLYAELQATDFTSGELTHRAAECLKRGQPIVNVEAVNGFERAARRVFPNVDETWEIAERIAHRRFHLSGAGPTIFALASSRQDAREQAAQLGGLKASVHVVRTVKHARVRARA